MTLVICPECDQIVELEKRYCPNCTAPIPPNAKPAPDRTVPVNTTIETGRGAGRPQLGSVASKSRTLAIAVGAACVVVVFAVVGFVLYQAHVDEKANGISGPIGIFTGTTKVSDPTDDKTYVVFLQSIEHTRTDLRAGLPDAAGALVPTPPLGGAAQEAAPVSQPAVPAAAPSAAPAPASADTSGGAPAPAGAPQAAATSSSGAPATPPAAPGPMPASPAAPAGQSAPAAAPTDTSGPETTNAAFLAYAKSWQDLVVQFKQKPPPKDCLVLGNDYYRLLLDYTTMLDKLGTTQGLTADQVKQIENESQAQVRSDASVAEDALQNLCDTYKIDKSFTIAPELVPPPPSPAGT